ncbi:MAG: Zn-dependent exopeptidase M28 [bacterium]|nr:Zn-dependent exopeptidase M28 [bacterium]
MILALPLLFAVPTVASERGQAAADQVTEASYRGWLGDDRGTLGILYAHTGDDRGYGPEHDLARGNIFDAFDGFGLDASLHGFTYSSSTYYNVVGEMLGTKYPDRIYIVGAHFDSVNNPGADDNGSGTAAVLEAAWVLSQYDSESTIRFIAFDREEQGLVGSNNYSADHLSEDIRGVLVLDMVAYDTGTDSALIYGRTASTPIKSAVAAALDTYGQGISASVSGQLDQSDHAPFEGDGFQACLLIEGEVWDNPYYHTAQDSVETPGNINYDYARRMTRAAVGWLVDQAGVLIYVHNGDVDFDGLVTLGDFAVFQDCLAGPGTLPTPGGPTTEEACLGAFDFDLDDDVDLNDYAAFTSVFGQGDCNANDVVDEQDILGGTSEDCNDNDVPDECDLAAGTSEDCQPDDTPDECQLGGDVQAADDCTDAEPVCPDVDYGGSTTGANSDGSSSCGTSSTTADVWYSYTPESSGTATFALCDGTSYDAVLSVHAVCPGASGIDIDCDDDGCGPTGGPATVTTGVTADDTYLIRVTGYNGSSGAFTLRVTGPDCAVAAGDCNENGVPDECDIASGTSQDLNGNDIPDECET